MLKHYHTFWYYQDAQNDCWFTFFKQFSECLIGRQIRPVTVSGFLDDSSR